MATINFDDEMTDRERWAEDHGYWHGTCPRHGSFWTDTGSGCEICAENAAERLGVEWLEPEAGEFRCDNCGEIFPDGEKAKSEEFEYCPTCSLEFNCGNRGEEHSQ